MAHDTREMRLGLSGPLYQMRPRVVLGKSRRSKSLHVVFGAIRYKKRFGQRTLRRNNESKKSCYHPNRLNLLVLTSCSEARSKIFTKNSCLRLAPDGTVACRCSAARCAGLRNINLLARRRGPTIEACPACSYRPAAPRRALPEAVT